MICWDYWYFLPLIEVAQSLKSVYIMLMNRAVILKLPLLIFVLLAAESQAKAYVDPGSGAAYYQIFLIGIVGLLFRVKRIAAWFKGRKTTPAANDERA